MTLGDFVMYLVFIGLVVGPVVQIASIGTQITEAFAGLDRIREICGRSAREDEGDDARASVPREARRRRRVRGRVVRVRARASRCSRGSRSAPAGSTTALVGSSGSGKSTLVEPGDGVQSPDVRPHHSSTASTSRPAAARLPRAPRRRAAGQLPLRRHDRREHRLLAARRLARGDRGSGAARALRRVRRPLREGLRHDRRRARRQALGRPAPARRDRTRVARQPDDPDPRRSDLEPRQRERSNDPGRRSADLRSPAHDLRDRAPAVDDPLGRPDPGARRWPIVERGTHRELLQRRPLQTSCTIASTASRASVFVNGW
jgi:energy-coupling factor transporter ATP-binding protein EcfA2